jgi:CTP:molybdopterin cytidylyltransferase MocA
MADSIPAALILAAGGSTRMGQPKALLDLHGRPLIVAHVTALSQLCSPVVVVLGAHGDAIAEVLPGDVLKVWNPDWATTETRDSIALGLEALSPETKVVVTPVDVPPAPPDVLELLLAGPLPAVPIDEGERGHPVVVIAGAALLAVHTAPLHAHLVDATEVEVDWPDCTQGFNTPKEWVTWRG